MNTPPDPVVATAASKLPGKWLLSSWRKPRSAAPASWPSLSLALQGGGSHGAFTWGVLDALLADARIGLDGLSGSSAGALNAALLAHGWMQGGREGARQALKQFWTTLGQQAGSVALTQSDAESYSLSAAGRFLTQWAGHFSPAQLNPQDINPLRDLLAEQIDFERLRRNSPLKLFVGATQANSGRLRVFREQEISLDVLLATTCLPRMNHTVVIDGEAYWDGGYAANPPVSPLVFECQSPNIMLVLLDPLSYPGIPNTVPEIDQRLSELAFATNLAHEMQWLMQACHFAAPLGRRSGPLEQRLLALKFHQIDTQHLPQLHRTETKMLVHGPFLEQLFQLGRDSAAEWLKQHFDDLGQRSTMAMSRWSQ